MTDTVQFSRQEFEALAAKLDRFGNELTDKERSLVAALFDAGALALGSPDEEVSGYLLLPAVQKVREAAARAQVPGSGLGSDFLGALVPEIPPTAR